jgi:hypothetical protein
MDNRNKKEELQEVVEEAVTEPVEEIIPEEPVVEEVKEVVKEDKEILEPVEEKTEVVEEPQPSPDYKEKYRQSSKESLTQYFKNEKLKETIEEADTLPEPTEEELVVFTRSTGSNYDELDDFTKAMVKKALLSDKRWEKVSSIVKESKDLDAWADKVEEFTNSVETVAKYPIIEENADDFRKFCMKAQRRGMDIEDLATSFLYGLSSTPTKKPSKGSVLLTGGSTGRGEEKPAGLTDEDVKKIRLNDPKELRRLIKAGKVNIEI